jgi:glycosyltransferase involved in cell wall biosynthesis
VRCLWHSENKRLGGARNTGIRAAKGEFIYCVDSDDYIELTLCEKMYGAIVENNADMAVCDVNAVSITEKPDPTAYDYWRKPNGDFTSGEQTERFKSIAHHNAWLIMTRKSVIVDNELFFPEKIEYEDLLCTLWYLAAPGIARVYEKLYNYVIRDGSITQNQSLVKYELTLKCVSLILRTDYFGKLEKNVKDLLFLYYLRHIFGWINQVAIRHKDAVGDYCRDVVSLEDELGYKVEEIVASTEFSRFILNVFRFVKENCDKPDFDVEYIAYRLYQFDLFSLEKCRKEAAKYAEKRIVIWGAGDRGVRNMNILKSIGVEFELTDGDERKHGSEIKDLAVVKPWSELRERTDVVLVSVVGYYDEIKANILADSPAMEVLDFEELLEMTIV